MEEAACTFHIRQMTTSMVAFVNKDRVDSYKSLDAPKLNKRSDISCTA